MKRIAIAGIIFMLIFSISVNTTYSHEKAESGNLIGGSNDGRTLYVGGSGPNNYTHIQDAIDNASNGDTIFVYSGIYYENVVVNKSIELRGENAKETIIDGMKKNKTIFIITSNISVYNFTIKNGTIGIGNSRWHENLEKITIKNNMIVDNIQ
ncbi:MAG: hypothetical protein J7K95_00485, partial [Thermoplasmata archaeon]|nr:hypothetical protein [Thermoplasmata archaeon]